MKKLGLVTSVLVCMVLVSNFALATGTRTEFKDYEIKLVDDLYVGKNVKAIWTVSYSNTEAPVTVVKRKTFEGTEYTVHSKYFEVSYLATFSGFGTKQVRNSWSYVPKKINKAVINQEQLKRQEIITPNKVNDEMALELIASFLPDLINDGYTLY